MKGDTSMGLNWVLVDRSVTGEPQAESTKLELQLQALLPVLPGSCMGQGRPWQGVQGCLRSAGKQL